MSAWEIQKDRGGIVQEVNVYRWAGRMLMDAARMRRRAGFVRQMGVRDARMPWRDSYDACIFDRGTGGHQSAGNPIDSVCLCLRRHIGEDFIGSRRREAVAIHSRMVTCTRDMVEENPHRKRAARPSPPTQASATPPFIRARILYSEEKLLPSVIAY